MHNASPTLAGHADRLPGNARERGHWTVIAVALGSDIVERGLLDTVTAAIEQRGFDVMWSVRCAETSVDATRLVKTLCRAGTPVEEPHSLLFLLDLHPLPPGEEPGYRVDAGTRRLVRLHRQLSEALESSATPLSLAWTCRARDAWRVFSALSPPSEVEATKRDIERLAASFRTPFPVIRSLDRWGATAKVELVRYKDDSAVCKVFRPTRMEFFRRELEFLLANQALRCTPTLLEHGENWLVMRRYDPPPYRNVLGVRLMPLGTARSAIEGAMEIFEAGYAHMDFHPDQVLVDPVHGVKLIDYDRVHRYTEKPSGFGDSYDIAGPPVCFAGPVPNGRRVTYLTKWKPVVGLSVESLLHDPLFLQHLKRAAFVARRTIAHMMRRTLKSLRAGR